MKSLASTLWIKLLFATCLVFILQVGSVHASSLYFDDGTSSDMRSAVIDADHLQHSACSGCHQTTTASSCTGTAVQTAYLGTNPYVGARNCASTIADKMSTSPPFGVRMPQGCTTNCVTFTRRTQWNTWISNGMPLSAPFANVDSVNNSQETTATIQFDIDTNTLSQGSYVVEYSLSPSTAYNLNAISVTSRNSTSQLNNIVVTLGNDSPAEDDPLTCGTTYNYRVRATNGAANDDVTGSFTTDACDPATISFFNATTSFTEQTPLTVDSSVTLTPADSTTITQAVMVITNPQTGDSLACTTTSLGGATCGSAGTTLTISGSASFGSYDTLIQGVQFNNTSDTPNTTTRVVSLQITDGNAVPSNTPTRNIPIIAVNDQPSVTGWSNTPAFVEDVSGAVTLDPSVTITDPETSDSLNQATIEITNDQTGDSLACTAGFPGGGSCSYSNGFLTISGVASRAAYEGYIEGVQFNNTSDTPNTTNRNVRLIVRDNGSPNLSSVQDDLTLTVAATNDAPTAVADGSAGGPPNGFVAVAEGGTVDNGTDGDGTNDDLRDNDSDPDFDSLTTTQTGCAGGNGTGPSNAAAMGFTLDTDGTFSYTHDNSNTTSDQFSYCVSDGNGGFSTAVTVFIDITPVNDIPVVSNFSGNTPFTEQTPVVVDSTINIADSDNTQLNQAQMQITNNQTGDTLACTTGLPFNGITSCNFSGNLLTISGTSDIVNYDTVIQGVQFNNTEQHPSTTARNISLTVRDASNGFSSTVNKGISPITRVNDQPTAANDGAAGAGNGFVTLLEGASVSNAGDLRSNDNDPDTDPLTTVQVGCAGGNGSAPANASAFTLNTDGTFNYTHNGGDTTSDSFTYCVFDTVLYSTLATVFIDITAVNDQPIVSGFSGSVAFTEQTPVTINSGIVITDSESANLDSAEVQISGGYETGSDTLACNGALPAGIASCSFAAGPGTLTLSGTASLASYQTALDSVQFNSSSDNPSQATRTISLRVEDQENGLFSATSNKTVMPITRLNDAPTLAAIGAQVGFEDTTADPFTFNVTAIASDVDVNDDFNDGGGTLTYSLSGAPAGMTISNASPTHGEISWNPPITGTFGQVYGPISVLIEDGDEDVSAPNSVAFSITVSPPDVDMDLVPNYDDVCLTMPDGTNADNDNDGTPGSDGGVNDGGDVCDLDDDNDGISDIDEGIHGLDPFDPADALQDADNDGISNLDEINNGTDPNFGNLNTDATGYLTPFVLPIPAPESIAAGATSVTPSTTGPFRPGRNTITWTASSVLNSNLGSSDQTLDIRPLVNFQSAQQAEEGDVVTVNVTLNGDAPEYPATVDYTVSGTASNPADHDAVAGTVTFNMPSISETITVNIASDALSEADETVILTLTSATNAAVGMSNSHRITIVEGNVAPKVRLRFSQVGPGVVSSAFVDQGVITIDAIATDVNASDTHSYDWSGTDNSLTPPLVTNMPQWTLAPVAGNYLIDVVVTDSGSPAASTRVRRILNITAAAPVLGVGDSDGDMMADNAEGFGDADGDGIPNYLDANEGATQSSLVPDQTIDIPNTHLIETDPGLSIAMGSTAQAANNFGVLLTDNEIAMFGSSSGGAPTNPDDGFRHIGGIFDFEISGLIAGASAHVVIPLQNAIPRRAVYRKFNAATGWGGFVVDANNSIASAPGEPGTCPQPGSSLYRSGLNYLDNCVQLTITDGGPNDTDNATNSIITDPGTLGIRLTEPEIEAVEDGGGRMSPLLLMILVIIGAFGAMRKRNEMRIRL